MCGVYPASATTGAGDEISSTYEGRHITLRDDELEHPYSGASEDGFVDKGDPVILAKAGNGAHGRGVGVAFIDGTASADLIPVDTEGIWKLMCYADDDAGGSEIVPGDALFISDDTPGAVCAAGVGSCCISKRRNLATQIPFGYALGNIDSAGEGVIAVKVHWDPEEQQDEYFTFLAADTADDMKSFTVNDAAVEAEGMFTVVDINYNNTGVKTGTATATGLNIDMATTAAIPYYYGIQVYSATIDDKVMGMVCGLSFYMEDQGAAVGAYVMIDVGRNCPHASLGRDTIIRVREHTTVQADSSFLLLEGTNALGYLVNFNDAAGAEDAAVILDAATCNQTADYRIRVRLATAAVDRYIYLFPI